MRRWSDSSGAWCGMVLSKVWRGGKFWHACTLHPSSSKAGWAGPRLPASHGLKTTVLLTPSSSHIMVCIHQQQQSAAVSSSQQQSATASSSQQQPYLPPTNAHAVTLCSHSPLIKASFSTIHSEPHYMPHLAPNPLTHLALRYFPYPMIPPRLMLSTWYMYMQREVYSCSDYAVNTLLT